MEYEVTTLSPEALAACVPLPYAECHVCGEPLEITLEAQLICINPDCRDCAV